MTSEGFQVPQPHTSPGILSFVCLQCVIIWLNKKSQGHSDSQSQRKVRHVASSSLICPYLTDEDFVCLYPGVWNPHWMVVPMWLFILGQEISFEITLLIAMASKVEGDRACPLLRVSPEQLREFSTLLVLGLCWGFNPSIIRCCMGRDHLCMVSLSFFHFPSRHILPVPEQLSQ